MLSDPVTANVFLMPIFSILVPLFSGEWWVGGGGGGNLGVLLVRVCEPVFRNLPHSYTWPLKKRTHSYTRSSEIMTHLYTAR